MTAKMKRREFITLLGGAAARGARAAGEEESADRGVVAQPAWQCSTSCVKA